MKSLLPKYYFLIILLGLGYVVHAQSLYPVTASLRMSGPSSSRFFTFSQPGMIAGRPNRIALDLRLNDLDEPSLDVRLKWDISGSDISFSSSDISATNIVSLLSGQFVRLDNAALASYFQPSAFDGLSDDFLLRSDGLLPEGMYEICVTAYELTQGKQVSNTSCQVIFLEELEPPLIVTPVDEVLPTYPQNVILNWQANHLAVFPVQYTIALWEELEGLSPDQITFQTPPLYTETVLNRTAFVFNASHPLLTPGRNYLVQVRARDNDAAYVFKNNGFSPIHRFRYGAQEDEGICEAPTAGEFGFGYGNLLVLAWNGGDLASALASADAKVEGTASPAASGLTTRASTTSVLSISDDFGETTKKASGFYRIRFRMLGTEEWSSVDTDQLTAGIKGLRAGKTYEIEISKVCASGIVPSPIFQVTVPKVPRRTPLECGSEMSEEGFDQTPIDELFVNDTIIAAGAYVRITNVVGGPAGWTGEGEVAMPFLPKSRVAVEFSNIVVNVNYELIAGYIETVYDDKMSNVVNLDAISGLFDNGPSIEQVNYAIPIDTIMQGPGGIIIVVRSDGGIDSFKAPIIVIAPGLEAVLVNGYQFEVFDMDDMVDSIAPEQFTFMAHPEQKYGFDDVKKELLTEYKEEAGFVMPYKSVAFGEADKIKAVLTGDPPNDAEVHFVELSTAADLTFTRNGNEYDIITGGLKSGLSQVIALGPNGIMGMFQVMGTAKEFVTVHLVPLNGYGKNTDAQSIEEAATDILRQAGFSVRVDVLDVGLQYDGAKISLENHFASAYSPAMKQIISQLGRKVNEEAHDVYMILTDKMEGNTTGFMPKGMGIGFMELGGGGQTLAHELCHGLFNMPHIFEGFYESKTKGSLPDNLMDYNEGTALYYRQWARMQSPGVHLAWFDDAGEGKSVSNPDYFCINNKKADAFIGKCLMAYDGRPILLNEPLVQIAFYSNEEEIDSLKGRLASWRFKSDGFAYIPNLNDNKEFEGYANTKGIRFNWVEAACSNPITVSTNRNLCTYTSSDQSIVGSDSYCKCLENEEEKGKYLNPIISYWGNDFEDKFNNTSALRNEKFQNDRQEIVDMDIQSCFLCVRNKAAEIDLNSWVLQDRLSALFNHTGKQFTVLVNTLDYVVQQEEVDKLGAELYNKNFSGSNSTALLFINLFKDRGYENVLNPNEVRFLCQYKIVDPSGMLGEFTVGGSLGELIANLYKSISKPHYSAIYKALPNENFAIILSETNEWVRGYGEITSMEVWKYNVPAPVHYIGTGLPVEDPILHAKEAFQAINDESKFDIQKINDLKDACALAYFQSKAESELKGKFLSYLEQWSNRGAAVSADCVFKELTATDAIVMPVLQAASYVPGIDIAASAVGYGIASYQGDVLYQEEFGAGLAMSVFFVDGKAIGEITERVVKGIVVNTAKKKYVNLAKQNVDEFAEFLVDGMNMAESRARRYAEKLHSKPRDQYEDYINQTVYERLGGARDELEFDWRLTLVFDDDGIFGKFIEKFGLEKTDELWRFCNAKSYNESGLKEVFKYFGDINSTNGPEILTLFIGAKGRTAQLIEAALKGGTDASTGKVLLEDLGKGSREFVAFIDGRGDEGIKAWVRLVQAHPEIKLNPVFLEEVSKWPTSWEIKTGRVVGTIEVFENGIPLARIFPDRVVASGRSVIGQPGNKILNRVPLIKNMVYEVDGIEYVTDELSRVISTSGDLDDMIRVRLGNQQIKAIDVKDGVRGSDQGGHIIGARFFGPGEQINYYPQSANLNQGGWKIMENQWADAMVKGQDVKVQISAIYESKTMRPDAFEVSYWIDGNKSQETFFNQ